MSKRNGVIVYQGPSRIDGAPIVAIATGLARSSVNEKTGGSMIQTYILRADVHPSEALATGKDVSICGGCIHRPDPRTGKRSCYVQVRGPASVYRCFARGGYDVADPNELPELFAGRLIRLGSYGDPAAVPMNVWAAMLERATGWTGYTHQARTERLRDALRFCQLSADSEADAKAAHDAGVGSFRVLRDSEEPLPFEWVCPASPEAGKTTTCQECQACTGWNGANVVIRAHGAGRGNYKPARRGITLPVLNPERVAKR